MEISQERCIYRVPSLLRQTNKEAYKPVAVAIGPIHHSDESLTRMNGHKEKYRDSFLRQDEYNDDYEEYCLEIVRENEMEIRNCYADRATDIITDHRVFNKMVLTDSAFIIELIKKGNKTELSCKEDDLIWGKPYLKNEVLRDIMLLENQLPLFIIMKLYNRRNGIPTLSSNEFCEHVCKFMKYYGVEIIDSSNPGIYLGKCSHLLDVLRKCQIFERESGENEGGGGGATKLTIVERMQPKEIIFVVLRAYLWIYHKAFGRRKDDKRAVPSSEYSHEDVLIPTASKLHAANVKFEVGDRRFLKQPRFFDEKRGILTLPKLILGHRSVCMLRNIIAFEQCHYPEQPYVISYMFFLNSLIDTPNDIHLLVEKGILQNLLGSDGNLSSDFNGLLKSVDLIKPSYANMYREHVITKLNEYYNTPYNRDLGVLKQVYFAHPWSGITVLYAFIMLFLTLLQVYTGFKGKG